MYSASSDEKRPKLSSVGLGKYLKYGSLYLRIFGTKMPQNLEDG
jgi:hypothetical protein